MIGRSSGRNVWSTNSIGSTPTGGRPRPIRSRAKSWVPTASMMDLMPLCPPELPWARRRTMPSWMSMSSEMTSRLARSCTLCRRRSHATALPLSFIIVVGSASTTVSPPSAPSATMAGPCDFPLMWRRSLSSTIVAKPTLCRVRAYRGPGFPSPTISFVKALVGVVAAYHGGDGLEEDLQVESGRPMLDIEEIVAGPLLDGGLATHPIDLRPASHAGLLVVALVIPWDEPAELLHKIWPLGAGAHEAHVAQEDVDELWQLVDGVAAEQAAKRRGSAIVGRSPHRAGALLGFDTHRTEFHAGERPTVDAHSFLDEECRARRGELDRNGDGQEQRR